MLLALPLLAVVAPESAAQTIDSTTINEGQTKTFTISGIPNSWTGTVTRDSAASGTAIIISSCLVISVAPSADGCWDGTASWDSSARTYTFDIRAVADADATEGDEPYTFTLYDSDDNSRTASFTITIKDGAATSIDSTTIDEGRSKVFTVSDVPSHWVDPIAVSATSGSATANLCDKIGSVAGLDACVLSDHLNRAAGTVKVRIRALRDAASESDESFTLTLTDDDGNGSNTFSETITVRNGTAVPAVNAKFDRTGTKDGTAVASYEVEEATAGIVTVTGKLAAPATAPVTVPFEFTHLTTDNRDYRVLRSTATVGVGRTRFSVSVRVLPDTLVEDNEKFRITIPGNTATTGVTFAEVVIEDGSSTFDGQDGGDTDAIGYHGQEDHLGRYGCFVKGREDVLDVTPEGAVTLPRRGRAVTPPPPKLEIDWDRDSYNVGDTARIRIRSLDADGNPHRSCTDLPFRFAVDQSPRQWRRDTPVTICRDGQCLDWGQIEWRGAPTVLSPGPGDRWLTLGRGATQAELSFKVQAAGTMTFQVAQWIRKGGVLFNPNSPGKTYTAIWPTPEDRGGTDLTVGGSGATAVAASAACTGDCKYMYFRTRPQDVYEDSTGTVNVTVGFSSPTSSSFTLNYTLSGTATPGTDYTIPGRSGNSGSVSVNAGVSQVTIPVTIVDDAHEDNGETVFIALSGSGGYRAPDSFRLRIRNDDPLAPPTLVSIQAGDGVTEGTAATFTLTADPAPAEPLDVAVTVAAQGDYGVTAGTQTVTIPTSGSATLTLATTGDEADEADGSVSVTVDAGDGYSVGTPSSGSVAIADDDGPGTVTALPAGHPVVKYASLVKSFYDRIGARHGHGNGASGGWNKRFLKAMGHPEYVDYPQAAVTVADATRLWNHGGPGANTAWDGTVEAVTYAEQYFAGATTTTTTPPPAADPEVTIAAGSGVTEGGNAVFTVKANRAVDADLAVTLTVSEKAGSDFVAAADEGEKTVTILASQTEATLTVKTVDDAADEPDGSVTATVDAGTGYTVAAAPANAASVAVADNDAAALGPPVISVEDVTVQEGETAVVPVRLSPAPTKPVRLFYRSRYASLDADKRADLNDFKLTRAYLTFRPGETLKHARVPTRQDSHDDGGEVFEVFVIPLGAGAGGGAIPVTGVSATVTIENDDPLPGAWLARFGRAVAERALDGITARLSAERTPGLRGSIAGQALDFGGTAADGGASTHGSLSPGSLSGAGGAGPGSLSGTSFGQETQGRARGMTMQEVLRGSSFSLTGEADSSGGTLAFWGGTPGSGGLVSGAQFAGDQRGDGTAVGLHGETATALLGTDYARGRWLVGFALSQTQAEGGYAAIGGDTQAGDGDVEASLTATIPYAALAVTDRLRLWGAAGQGAGAVTVRTGAGESLSADTAWSMAAAGLRGDLLAPPAGGTGPSLALTSDAMWVRTSSEKANGLAASESDVSRLRLGLEGSWGLGTVTPSLELGARHDGGDAETGFGVELGGGLAWRDPKLGLRLDLSGRTLVAHDDGSLEDRGVSAQLAYDPAPASGRGLSLSLGQDWGGRAQGGLDALFQPEPLEDRQGSDEAVSRWSMEAAWGAPALGNRFTGSPWMGLGLATGARDYSLGWRLTPEAAGAPNLSFGLKATRRESGTTEAEHTVGIEFSARW